MISELLAYDFMQRAILAVIAISIFSPILGLFLILRRQSLMSDTLSHVSLAGVAVGIFLGQSTTWMTLVVVVIAALVLEYLRVSYKHYMEISTAILMSMGLAVALIHTKSHIKTINITALASQWNSILPSNAFLFLCLKLCFFHFI